MKKTFRIMLAGLFTAALVSPAAAPAQAAPMGPETAVTSIATGTVSATSFNLGWHVKKTGATATTFPTITARLAAPTNKVRTSAGICYSPTAMNSTQAVYYVTEATSKKLYLSDCGVLQGQRW